MFRRKPKKRKVSLVIIPDFNRPSTGMVERIVGELTVDSKAREFLEVREGIVLSPRYHTTEKGRQIIYFSVIPSELLALPAKG